MGFYAPAQIVRDAKENGVLVLHPDINRSARDNMLEPIGFADPFDMPGADLHEWKQKRARHLDRQAPKNRYALRLGFRQIDGIGEDVASKIVEARDVPFTDLEDLKARTGIPVAAIRKLAAY